jgi:hypothetical protein
MKKKIDWKLRKKSLKNMTERFFFQCIILVGNKQEKEKSLKSGRTNNQHIRFSMISDEFSPENLGEET